MLGIFRELFLGGLGQQLSKAQQPVYGEAQQAQFLNQLNETTGSAFNKISQQLAGVGGLGSGRHESMATDLALEKGRATTDFFSQLPFLEKQAQLEQMLPLLQLGLGFVGQGNKTVTQTGNEQFSENSQTQGTASVQGPGFLRSFAGGLAGGLGQRQANQQFEDILGKYFGQGGNRNPNIGGNTFGAQSSTGPINTNFNPQFGAPKLF